MTPPDPFYLFIAGNKQRREKHTKLFRAYMGESYAPFANEKAKAEFEAYNAELRIQFENSKKSVQTKLITVE